MFASKNKLSDAENVYFVISFFIVKFLLHFIKVMRILIVKFRSFNYTKINIHVLVIKTFRRDAFVEHVIIKFTII